MTVGRQKGVRVKCRRMFVDFQERIFSVKYLGVRKLTEPSYKGYQIPRYEQKKLLRSKSNVKIYLITPAKTTTTTTRDSSCLRLLKSPHVWSSRVCSHAILTCHHCSISLFEELSLRGRDTGIFRMNAHEGRVDRPTPSGDAADHVGRSTRTVYHMHSSGVSM